MLEDLISIVVPIYNVDKYLNQCIDSLINQTYKNLEIILVNDGSVDNCPKICDEYAAKDNRVKVIHKVNGGISDARNKGIIASTGEYMMFVDSDDWIELDTCELLLENIKSNKSDISMCSYVREFNKKSLPKIIFNRDMVFDESECKNIYRRLFGLTGEQLSNPENADSICPVWMKLYKSSLIKGNNILFKDIKNIGTYEDGIFNIYVFKYVKKASFINKYLYHYRKTNEESITSKYKENLLIQWVNLFQIMSNYIDENKLDDSFREALNNRIALSILGLGINICLSDKNMLYKIKEIKKIINIPMFKKSYKHLILKNFPIHWKVFYGFAKYNFATGVYILLLIIKKIIGKK